MRMAGHQYIVFFDLDRTITGKISGRAIAHAAFRKGLLSFPDIFNALWLSAAYRLGTGDQALIISKMIGWIRGLREEVIDELCSEVFDKTLKPSIYREIYAEIVFHKDKGARTVILSSSLHRLCILAADHLGIDDVISTHLEVIDGLFTGKAEGEVCFGKEKAKRLKEYCEKNNSKAADAWYYADSFSDLEALEQAGTAVCINPEKRLYKAASDRGWRICNWKDPA